MPAGFRFLVAAAACLGCAAIATADVVPVSDAARRGQAPSIAVGADGTISVVWLDKGELGTPDKLGEHAAGGHSHQSWADVSYARSTDGGRSFSRPVRVNAEDGEVWGFSVSKPAVGVGADGTVHVFYPANGISSRTGKPVAESRYARSTDGGRTFSKPLRVNSEPAEDLSALVEGGLAQAQVFGTMAVGREGEVYTLWLDTRGMTAAWPVSSVYMAVSRDGGRSFEADREIFGAGSCPCCQLTATIGSEGELYLGGRVVSKDNQRDPVIAVSNDGGRSFSERVKVGGPPWVLDGCPLKPVALAAQGGFLHAAVFNGAAQPAGVLYSRSTDGGRSFGEAIALHPQAAVSDAPALVASGAAVYAFWHAKLGAERQVFWRLSTDRGASFGAVAPLAQSGGSSSNPAAAALPDGRVLVVWQQGEQIVSSIVAPPQGVAAPTP